VPPFEGQHLGVRASDLTEAFRCVFGEMFVRRPILAGKSDVNQLQMIFELVGTPTEETMPGWSELPGCEGVKEFKPQPGNLAQQFRAYVRQGKLICKAG
jgi:hypothetical protein